jgi:hypothetical protein
MTLKHKTLSLSLALLLLCMLSLVAVAAPLAPAGTYYVAPDGDDGDGDGSAEYPWATITHALDQVPDGSTILVQPGTYEGQVRLRGSFEQGVTVRAAVPYQARLRHDGTVVTCFYGQGITLQGFDIAHTGPGAGALVIQVQDLRGDPGGEDAVRRITLRDNVLHDSYNNDILKINNGAREVWVQGNLFYNQAGSDEHIDVNSVRDVVIEDNVFFNDFAGSGREPDASTSSFVVIKDSNGDHDGQLGSEGISVRRNIFLHWEGSSGQGYVRVGEDATAYHEARDVLIENNLLLGDNVQQIRSPFQLMGVYSVSVRANTVAGDLPAKEYGARIFTYGDNPDNEQIHLHNNIWSDPTGTMGDTFNRGDDTQNLTFDHNLFWNAGAPFPISPESIIEVTDDANRVVGDPLLGAQDAVVLPRWDPGAGQFADGEFADGSTSIRQAFERLVALYGTPAAGSPAIDAADPAYAPREDILGQPRPSGDAPDIGAYERQGSGRLTLRAVPAAQAIAPGGRAVYALHVTASGALSASVALTHSPAPPSLTLHLAPTSVIPGQPVTLTVTDTHAGTLSPGLRYTLTVTGSGAGLTARAIMSLIVSGARLYLPLTLKER